LGHGFTTEAIGSWLRISDRHEPEFGLGVARWGFFRGAKSAGLRSFALSADWDPETAPANFALDFYIKAL